MSWCRTNRSAQWSGQIQRSESLQICIPFTILLHYTGIFLHNDSWFVKVTLSQNMKHGTDIWINGQTNKQSHNHDPGKFQHSAPINNARVNPWLSFPNQVFSYQISISIWTWQCSNIMCKDFFVKFTSVWMNYVKCANKRALTGILKDAYGTYVAQRQGSMCACGNKLNTL